MFDEENLISLAILLSFCLSFFKFRITFAKFLHLFFLPYFFAKFLIFAFFASERKSKMKRNGRE